MSVAILSPLAGDTTTSPVAISTAYDFSSGPCTITTSLTGAAANTTGALSGVGLTACSLATASTGPVSASSTANPASGGSSSVAFTIGTGTAPPIIIETIDPNPPPPPPPPGPPVPGPGPLQQMAPQIAALKDYKAKGSIKGAGIVQVKYRVLQVNLTTLAWLVVVPYAAANINGNNWNANSIKFTPAAKCAYALQVEGYNATGGKVAQFTKAIVL